MIENDRIPQEIETAIDRLNSIKYVYERDGFVSPKYIAEKATCAQNVVEWLLALTK